MAFRLGWIGGLALLLASGPAEAQDCQTCYNTGGGGGTFHYFSPGPLATHQCGGANGCHSETMSGSCHSEHLTCDSELAQLYSEVQAGDVTHSELALLLTRFPETVRYNEGRRAIQITGCNGVVIAHHPVRNADGDLLIAIQSVEGRAETRRSSEAIVAARVSDAHDH